MKNVHLIPTTPNDETAKGIWIKETRDWCNIYITNNEEIKEGNWYYLPKENKITKCPKTLKLHSVTPEWTQKIILTTDQDLIANGIEQISEDTLLKIVEHINSGKNIECFDEL